MQPRGPIMKIGVSIRSFYPPGESRAIVDSMVSRVAAARRAGLDSLFVGDHHATPSPYIQNVPILGRLLAEWGDAPVGALFLLPLWDPVLLAEQIGTLASIAQGRFIAQCCVGAQPEQFRALGKDPSRRGRDFEIHFDVLRRLLAGESAKHPVSGAEVSISPSPPEPVEYWIGADVPVAIDRAARLADAWLVGPNVLPDTAAQQLASYYDRCAHYDRIPRATPIRRNCHVSGSAAEVERDLPFIVDQAALGADPGCLIIGTIDQVASQLRTLAANGFSDVIVRHFHPEESEVLASTERLAVVREQVQDA